MTPSFYSRAHEMILLLIISTLDGAVDLHEYATLNHPFKILN